MTPDDRPRAMAAPPGARTARHASASVHTAAYCVAFVALGLIGPLFGPALSSLAAQTGVGLGAVSTIFLGNALGRLGGSFLAGRLLDRLPGHRIVAGGLVAAALLMTLVPLVPALPVLVVTFCALGIAQHLIDVGGNTLMVWVHGGARVGPFMNGLHLAFGLGAFLAPLLVAGTLTAAGTGTAAFWVVAAGIVPIAAWLSRVPSPARPLAGPASASGRAPVTRRDLALVCGFFFLIVGVEVAMSGWTFNYGTAMGLGRDRAAALASVFWGAYLVSRVLAIPVSIRLAPERILRVSLIGGVAGAAVLVLGSAWRPGMWLGAAGLGFFVAALFPTMLTWLSGRIRVTGRVNGWLFAASNLGAMLFPFGIGQLFEPVGSRSLPLTALVSLAAATALFAVIGTAVRDPAVRRP